MPKGKPRVFSREAPNKVAVVVKPLVNIEIGGTWVFIPPKWRQRL